MRRLSALLPLVIVALGACEQVTEDSHGSALTGGGGPGDDSAHCSGLVKGAHCGPPNTGSGTTLGPGELLPAGVACNPADPFDLTCLVLGMECLFVGPGPSVGECGIPGLIGGPGGVEMTPGAPPVDESSLWIAVSGNSQVVKVNTRGSPNPYIAGRFPSIVPYCTHVSFSLGFSARSVASGAMNISNWALGGPGIDPAEVPLPPALIPLNERYRTVRNGSANISGSTLQLVNGASQLGTAWYRLPQAAYNGFATQFSFQATTAGVQGFALSVQNDGNSTRVLGNSEEGYKSDLSISFDRLAGTGAVEVFFWGASLGRFPTATLSTANLAPHVAQIIYNVTAPFPGAGTGTIAVLIDGVPVTPLIAVNLTAKLLSPSNFNDSCQPYWGTAPSRTTLDGNSDAFVGNRAPQGTITKYAGTSEAARCTRDINGNGFQLTETSTTSALGPGGNGWNDECINYTAPVGGNKLYNGRNTYVRAVTVSTNDIDSGPAGSVWVGTSCGLVCGSAFTDWHAAKLRNRDGYELAYFDIGVNPYGAAISGDGRVWYTSGHNGTSNTYVDSSSYNDSTSGAAGCEGQGCVGPVFSVPASGAANLTIKNGAYCNSRFYGMTVDEWSNVWNADTGCSSVVRLTPPGYQRIDQPPGVVAGAQGHWDMYRLENYPVGVFVTKAKPAVVDDPLTTTVNETRPARPALMFAGADTSITQLDPITMNPATRIRYTGTLSGHGGLSFDADDYLWRVGGNYVSRILPYGLPPLVAENKTVPGVYGVTTRFNLNVGGSTYTYSDFTGYTRANIAGRQVNLPRFFTSTCGDNARKRWTRLKWTGSVPDHTQLEFRIMTADTVLAAQTKVAAGIPDAGPFYYTPNILPTNSTAAPNLNESGVWLPLELPLAAQVSEFIAIQTTFSADDFASTPLLTGIEVEGICEGLPVPACTVGAPACATGNGGPFNCGTIDNGCGGTISCGACGGAQKCGGAAVPNAVPNNVCGN